MYWKNVIKFKDGSYYVDRLGQAQRLSTFTINDAKGEFESIVYQMKFDISEIDFFEITYYWEAEWGENWMSELKEPISSRIFKYNPYKMKLTDEPEVIFVSETVYNVDRHKIILDPFK